MIVQQTRKKVQVSRASVCNRRLANLFSFFFERMNTQTKNSHPRSLLENMNIEHPAPRILGHMHFGTTRRGCMATIFLCAIFFLRKEPFNVTKRISKLTKNLFMFIDFHKQVMDTGEIYNPTNDSWSPTPTRFKEKIFHFNSILVF